MKEFELTPRMEKEKRERDLHADDTPGQRAPHNADNVKIKAGEYLPEQLAENISLTNYYLDDVRYQMKGFLLEAEKLREVDSRKPPNEEYAEHVRETVEGLRKGIRARLEKLREVLEDPLHHQAVREERERRFGRPGAAPEDLTREREAYEARHPEVRERAEQFAQEREQIREKVKTLLEHYPNDQYAIEKSGPGRWSHGKPYNMQFVDRQDPADTHRIIVRDKRHEYLPTDSPKVAQYMEKLLEADPNYDFEREINNQRRLKDLRGEMAA